MVFIQTGDAIDKLKRLQSVLSIKSINEIEVKAINKALQISRTKARTEIKKVYNISQRYLGGINYVPAQPKYGAMSGTLYAGRKPIPLDAFSPKQVTTTGSISITKKGKQKVTQFKRIKANPTVGIQIEIKRGEKEVLPYAFMIVGGAVRVFARGEYKTGTDHGLVLRHHRVNKTGNDTPIKPLITVSEFAQVVNKAVVGTDSNPGPIAKFAFDKVGEETERLMRLKLNEIK